MVSHYARLLDYPAFITWYIIAVKKCLNIFIMQVYCVRVVMWLLRSEFESIKKKKNKGYTGNHLMFKLEQQNTREYGAMRVAVVRVVAARCVSIVVLRRRR
jgi:hypothetical protein